MHAASESAAAAIVTVTPAQSLATVSGTTWRDRNARRLRNSCVRVIEPSPRGSACRSRIVRRIRNSDVGIIEGALTASDVDWPGAGLSSVDGSAADAPTADGTAVG